jgi:hypothetical protein
MLSGFIVPSARRVSRTRAACTACTSRVCHRSQLKRWMRIWLRFGAAYPQTQARRRRFFTPDFYTMSASADFSRCQRALTPHWGRNATDPERVFKPLSEAHQLLKGTPHMRRLPFIEEDEDLRDEMVLRSWHPDPEIRRCREILLRRRMAVSQGRAEYPDVPAATVNRRLELVSTKPRPSSARARARTADPESPP